MGFWDSYNKEMVRQGYTSHSEFHASDDEVETGAENEASDIDFGRDDGSGSNSADDSCEMEAERAAGEGDFETALQKYFESLEHGNIRMLLKIADLFAVVALYDKYNRLYRIGSDRNRDYSLEFAVTFYMASLVFPECESEAEEHLTILQGQCSNEYEFQEMVQRVSDRLSESILKDPIGFVRAILSQYQKTRS